MLISEMCFIELRLSQSLAGTDTVRDLEKYFRICQLRHASFLDGIFHHVVHRGDFGSSRNPDTGSGGTRLCYWERATSNV